MFTGIELLLQNINDQIGQSFSLPALRENKDKLDREFTLLLDGQVSKGRPRYLNLFSLFYCIGI